MALDRAEAWFRNELRRRCKLDGRMKTILTTGYRVDWTVNDAVREIVQNLLDGVAVAFGRSDAPLSLAALKCVEGEPGTVRRTGTSNTI